MGRLGLDAYFVGSPAGSSFVASFAYEVVLGEEVSNQELRLIVEENTIIGIDVVLGHTPYFELVDLLSEYGVPSEVWLRTIGQEREGVAPLSLLLYYPEEGILAHYTDADSHLVGGAIRSCLPGGGFHGIGLVPPEERLSFRQAVYRVAGRWFNAEFQALEDVSALDAQGFHDLFRDGNAASCLETPARFWAP